MIITIDELRLYIDTGETDSVLEAKLQALENQIRRATNNNFQQRAFRRPANITDGLFIVEALTPFSVGETVQVSESGLNAGLYTVTEVMDSTFKVKEKVYDEESVLVTKVEYPMDVKLGAVDILKWQLKNAAANSGDTSKKDIQSKTLSRYSVTYAADATETDIDENFGAPKKYTAFLKSYRKARF